MKDRTPLRILSRASKLAIAQVDEFIAECRSRGIDLPGHSRLTAESFGDKHKELSLLESQAQDFFTREIDEALLGGDADLGVHSAKDLPFPIPAGLQVAAVTGPADRRDALVVRAGISGETIDDLPEHARIGTSSPARKAYVTARRPGLRCLSIRGTIEERLDQLDRGAFDAVIVAACALDRLGLKGRIASYLDSGTHPLQGYLAAVGRSSDRELADLLAPVDVRRNWGRVWIAGAGPGDPDLVTVKTRRYIATADLIFHDALLSARLLEQSRAELVFVGKRRGKHEMTQAQINEALYVAALSGKRVLRLKGGDPLLFGRGSEEALYLRERLVEIELVPGVSAAFAAANYAGIPLTERAVSSSVAFSTGWPAEAIRAPSTDTAVYFMGGASLRHIAAKHLEAGAARDTPVALVANASLPEQRVWESDLERLSQDNVEYPTPILVFVGKTAKDRNALDWWGSLPVVWYTGTEPERYQARRQTEGRPCRLLHLPLIAIETGEANPALINAIGQIDDFDWLFFTSRWAVAAFFRSLKETGGDARRLAGLKIAAVGSGTAEALASHGIVADLVPAKESARGLLAAFDVWSATASRDPNGVRGQRCLVPASDQALPTLTDGLRERGCTVSYIVAYRNYALENVVYPECPIDEIVFTSPSTVRAYRSLFGDPVASKAKLVTMGESTAAELSRHTPETSPRTVELPPQITGVVP